MVFEQRDLLPDIEPGCDGFDHGHSSVYAVAGNPSRTISVGEAPLFGFRDQETGNSVYDCFGYAAASRPGRLWASPKTMPSDSESPGGGNAGTGRKCLLQQGPDVSIFPGAMVPATVLPAAGKGTMPQSQMLSRVFELRP